MTEDRDALAVVDLKIQMVHSHPHPGGSRRRFGRALGQFFIREAHIPETDDGFPVVFVHGDSLRQSQSFFQMADAPQGRHMPVWVVGRPISSQVTLPPWPGTMTLPRMYCMTDGLRPVV